MNTGHRTGAAPLAALILLITSAAQAANPTAREHEMREHGAHEHGHGVLEVAMEGHELHLELRIPAVNVVGFEHTASTDAQRDAVRRALATFKPGQDLFMTSAAARCALESAETALGEEREHAQGREEEHGHGKEHEHGHAEKNDKEHGHEKQAPSDAEVHSELRAVWRFHCDAPDKLERIEVKLFEHLLETDAIDAQVVTATVQKATSLRPGSATLDLRTR